MALFMDIHRIEGVTAQAAAQAHAADLQTQGRYGVDYQKYWVDEAKGQVFCLVDPVLLVVHAADLQTQGRYGVDYQKYWVDEAKGQVFCLVDAPSADAARAVHQEAHGLVADTIHPVVEGA